MTRLNPNLIGWDGPSQDAWLNPCSECEGSGINEEGERVDVDDYIATLCKDCNGTGLAPEPESPEPQELHPIFADMFRRMGLQ